MSLKPTAWPLTSRSSVVSAACLREFSSGPSNARAATASVATVVNSTAPTIRPRRPRAIRRGRARITTVLAVGTRPASLRSSQSVPGPAHREDVAGLVGFGLELFAQVADVDVDRARVAVGAVAIMSHIPNVLLVRPDFPAKSVQDLIAYAKANPGRLNYASQGIGATSHLTAALFASITHTQLVHVPYKGTAPALNDLIASHVDLMFTELSTSLQLHRSGRARILAVATKQRVASLPDIPTLAEAGVQGCESNTWNAITAPPKTPAAIVAKLNAAANTAMQAPDLLARYQKLSASPGGGTPAEIRAFIQDETRRWGAVIRAAGITAQ